MRANFGERANSNAPPSWIETLGHQSGGIRNKLDVIYSPEIYGSEFRSILFLLTFMQKFLTLSAIELPRKVLQIPFVIQI